MDHSVRIELPSDDEGYVSFECDHCQGRFKLHAGEVDDAEIDLIYCPLCGLSGEPGTFLTRDLLNVAQAHATQMAQNAVHEMLQGIQRKTRNNKFVRMEVGRQPPPVSIPKIHEVTDLAIVAYACCSCTAKIPHSDALSGSYCPFCGSEQI